jgi:hypothetical protein
VHALRCAAGPLTTWRRGERRFGIGGVMMKVCREKKGSTGGAKRRGNRLSVAENGVERVGKRRKYVAGFVRSIEKSGEKTVRLLRPLHRSKTVVNHQICVKSAFGRVLQSVVFSRQNCRFHTSLNFSRWNRCVSIPRVLSAPAPGVTP